MDPFTSEVGRRMRDDELPERSVDDVLRDVRHSAQRRAYVHRAGVVALATVAVAAVGVTAAVLGPSGDPVEQPADTPVSPTGFRPTNVEIVDADAWWVLGSIAHECDEPSCLRLSRTSDGGASFTAAQVPPGLAQDVEFADTDHGWAWEWGGTGWVTHDGGATWEPLPVPEGSAVQQVATWRDRVFVVVDGTKGRQVLTGPVDGGALAAADLPAVDPGGLVQVVAAGDSVAAMLGPTERGTGRETLYTSGDGEHWTEREHACDSGSRTDLLGAPDGAWWLGCEQPSPALLYVSTDGARSWEPVPDYPAEHRGQVVPASGERAVTLGLYGGLGVLPASGRHQAVKAPVAEVPGRLEVRGETALLPTADGLLLSRDGGRTWLYVDGFGPEPEPSPPSDGAAAPVDTAGAVPWSDRTDAEPWKPTEPGPFPTEQPDRWPFLVARLTLPESVPAGGALEYLVTLHNRGDKPVDLAPCPAYRQEVIDTVETFEPMPGVGGEWRLNCDAAPTLPAGARRSYVMRLEIPQTVPTGETLINWRLVDLQPDYGGQEFLDVTGE